MHVFVCCVLFKDSAKNVVNKSNDMVCFVIYIVYRINVSTIRIVSSIRYTRLVKYEMQSALKRKKTCISEYVPCNNSLYTSSE